MVLHESDVSGRPLPRYLLQHTLHNDRKDRPCAPSLCSFQPYWPARPSTCSASTSASIIAVSGNGLVVRITDGKLLGIVEPIDGSVYWEWASAGDTMYYKGGDKKLTALQLGIDGDELTTRTLWTSDNDYLWCIGE